MIELVARAEPTRAWPDVAAAMAAAVGRASARWLDPDPAPGTRRPPRALVEVGPADPVIVIEREGAVLVVARTTPWGPGYHARVVEVLDALEPTVDGWLEVRDPTGYAQRRERGSLERRFLAWAHGVWGSLAPGAAAVGLGLGEGPVEVPSGLVATSTGFKDRAWVAATRAALERSLRGGPIDPAVREAFLWWTVEPDALDWSQLGRALCASDVIWRPIDGEDAPDQADARASAAACFEAALRLDPHAPVPLEELRRLYALLDREADASAIPTRVAPREPFRGGYREGWIRWPIANRWTAHIPGWLRASVDAEDGHDVLWDADLTAHVTVGEGSAFSARAEVARHLGVLPAPERGRAQVELLDNGCAAGYAVVVPSAAAPEREALIQGQVGCERQRIGFTVVARSREARDVALRMSRSLRPLRVGS